ncbi:ribonuclease [Altererythrobacter aquiaggeris]|uniref:ribonuclease n=1 Tax=Aestuarierythrobacter aquiaggeris TaxID=1898396 RepID=UPI003018B484
MAEWLVEHGVAEDRALLMDKGIPVAARIYWPGSLTAGQIEDAVLVSKPRDTTRGRAEFASGEQALVDRLPANAQEGSHVRLVITRAAIAERSRVKLAQARPTGADTRPAPGLTEQLRDAAESVTVVHKFSGSDWEEIWTEACDGTIAFPGGSIHCSATPAMTLIDVDGQMAAGPLALAAVPAIAAAIGKFDLSGSIGIDFPTIESRSDRKLIDDVLAAALARHEHERTAMNGFGFVQIVSRMTRPSLLHIIGHHRADATVRLLLRRAEEIADPGALLLTMHPAVRAKLQSEWLDDLARRTGREIRLETDPGLAVDAAFAQNVPV